MLKYDFANLTKNKKVAVAVSGGSDSMALLHYMTSISEKYQMTVIALNVEHGIRGQESINDSKFVADYCAEHGIELISYSIDCPTFAKKSKLTLEESARVLRYDCFFDAIKSGKCDLIATAHHASDNVESILFNILRGSGLKGLAGIRQNYCDLIIRPFLKYSKADVEEYIAKNSIPFVTDSTNLDDDYTRNHLRLNVIPEIKKVFPAVEKSLTRIAEIATEEDEFLDRLSLEYVRFEDDAVYIETCAFPVLLRRATILAFKHLGIEKDWEKVHVDDVLSLTNKENGSVITLPKGVVAVKEYDKIVICHNDNTLDNVELPFVCKKINVGDLTFNIEKVEKSTLTDELIKKGLYADLDKFPKSAIIRTKRNGDLFTKFGGGTKSIGDYFTDIKLPNRLRNNTLLVADGNKVYAILGIAISNDVKIDENTVNVISLGEKTF